MRPITLEIFKLIYLITGAKRFSYVFALILSTVMNVILLRGLSALFITGYPMLRQVLPIFQFPKFFASGVALLLLNIFLVPFSMLEHIGMMKTHYTKLILFSLIVLLLFAYGTFIEKF